MRYTWACKRSGKKIEVTRKMADSDIPPTSKECLSAGWAPEEAANAKDWTKVITGGSFTKGFGQKGRW